MHLGLDGRAQVQPWTDKGAPAMRLHTVENRCEVHLQNAPPSPQTKPHLVAASPPPPVRDLYQTAQYFSITSIQNSHPKGCRHCVTISDSQNTKHRAKDVLWYIDQHTHFQKKYLKQCCIDEEGVHNRHASCGQQRCTRIVCHVRLSHLLRTKRGAAKQHFLSATSKVSTRRNSHVP